MSTHEQWLAALQTEIQALEASNIAPKELALLAETSAPAVPIVTDAIVAALEERIRARINEGRLASTTLPHAIASTKLFEAQVVSESLAIPMSKFAPRRPAGAGNTWKFGTMEDLMSLTVAAHSN
ncbi:hypothetical protein HD554DRAFT_2313977 [Boletus coccyginus]|nr:hypothetical protein HD554DRAFT_2313977 [Boletus coccyginus]